MSIEALHLRKLLQLLYAGSRQQALLRAEIRADRAKQLGLSNSGGDFYAPFWADARDHILNIRDLRDSTSERISKNKGRGRLYKILQDGFLNWWDGQRRWTNAPFEVVRPPTAVHRINDFLSVKLENFMAVRDMDGVERYIYPYFYEEPVLKNEGARISIWIFSKSFPGLLLDNFRVLDVPRGRIYSPDRCYLEGDESDILNKKFGNLWSLYVKLEEEYE